MQQTAPQIPNHELTDVELTGREICVRSAPDASIQPGALPHCAVLRNALGEAPVPIAFMS